MLEYYSVLVGCKDEGVMTLATLAVHVPLRAVKYSQIWKMCHHLRVIQRSVCRCESELINIVIIALS